MGGHVPVDLVLKLKQYDNIKTFIETGTYKGGTACWAAGYFDKVITIELSLELLREAVIQHSDWCPNITFIPGDSKEELGRIVPTLGGQAIFWLDAHYSGASTVGIEAECPLLGELYAIVSSKLLHYILIDDAHMFTSIPASPHNPAHWPSYDTIQSILKLRGYVVKIVDDVILAVPHYYAAHAKEIIS